MTGNQTIISFFKVSIKKIFSFAASIINLFIIIFFLNTNSNAQDENSKYFSKDEGVLSIMYHRFEENKYPSTNIRIDVFKKHLEIIKNSKFEFLIIIRHKIEFNFLIFLNLMNNY